MLKNSLTYTLFAFIFVGTVVAFGFSGNRQNQQQSPATNAKRNEQVTVDKYVFKDKSVGIAITFETEIESESAASAHDRLLSIKFDKQVHDTWEFVSLQVFSDRDLTQQISKEKLGPILKNQHFYKAFRCDQRKYWVRLLLEPTGEIEADSWNTMLHELENRVNEQQIVTLQNSYFPVKLN